MEEFDPKRPILRTSSLEVWRLINTGQRPNRRPGALEELARVIMLEIIMDPRFNQRRTQGQEQQVIPNPQMLPPIVR